MKLDEIKDGVEYGVVDNGSRFNYDVPRRVLVLGIETVEEKFWPQYGGAQQTRNVRKVRIKFLDDCQRDWGNPVEAGKKGSTILVPARMIRAEWAELRGPIREKAEKEQRERDEKRALKKRLGAILGKRPDKLEAWISSTGWRGTHLEISGREMEKLLSLAESGRDLLAEGRDKT